MGHQLRGFIELYPVKFQPNQNSDNPFDGEDVVSENPISIALNTIEMIEEGFIYTSILMPNGQKFCVRVRLTYDQIKYLIKQAI
ncbi:MULTISPECIES: hypothetical protein [Sphingobacterium]|uniref:hypothetical protein n=1 Tax=Sphingobacterium TaxID=28453 RepID=UPI0025779E4A|nr:hypothetical protein [Sphingobacterium sp. N143]MDM1294282.1 hypothetical protein [Sphingobacterium sp. N143]